MKLRSWETIGQDQGDVNIPTLYNQQCGIFIVRAFPRGAGPLYLVTGRTRES